MLMNRDKLQSLIDEFKGLPPEQQEQALKALLVLEKYDEVEPICHLLIPLRKSAQKR